MSDWLAKQKEKAVQKVGEHAITHATGGAVDGKTIDPKYTKAVGGAVVTTAVNNKETIAKGAVAAATKK
jgi:hypothetical protein